MFEQGTPVKFRGGTGRKDEEQLIEGIVNGEVIRTPEVTYVPVFIPKTNQCVSVAESNIIV